VEHTDATRLDPNHGAHRAAGGVQRQHGPSEVGGPNAAFITPNATANRPGTTVIVYDDFHKPGGYTLADYNAKWSTLTLGEMAVEDTRHFDNHTSRSPRRRFGRAKTPASPITANTSP